MGLPRKRSAHAMRLARKFAGAAICAALVAIPARDASAQEVTAALGLAGGLVAGAYVTTGVYVLKARTTGWVLHSPSELFSLRPEVLPVAIGPIAGAVIGYQSPDKLSAAATWGAIGLAGGGAVGMALGQLIWGDSEGRWAGGTIGSALGLVVGAIAGAVTTSDDTGSMQRTAAPYLTFSIPLGAGR